MGDMGAGDMALPGDTTAPTVRSTSPDEGAIEVNRREPVVIRFSEPMNTAAGSVTASPGGPLPVALWSWDDVGSTLTVVPNTPWAQGTVTITVDAFEDPAGNVMEAPYEFYFETRDDVRPEVVVASPAEGETGVSARLEEIAITFSEPMNTSTGVIDAFGGSATVGEPTWSADGTTVTYPVGDLEYGREYNIALRDFRDEFGNRLDEEAYILDGFLDFTTGEDMDAPRAVRSEPMEGQMDVNANITNEIVITFDEAMDTSVTTFTLNDGTNDIPVTGTWTGAATVLRVNVRGILDFNNNYSLSLAGVTDRAGNAVDGAFYLLDGNLDFVVADDVFAPIVISSDPTEGATGIDQRDEINVEVVFSEAMDQTITTAPLNDGTTDVATLTGMWASPTIINFTIPAGTLTALTTYGLDLTGFLDLTGNSTDTGHAYLGDGILNFTAGDPFGESCSDVLTPASATMMDGVYTWTISSGQVSSREGGTDACADYTGTATRPDVVVAYDKVSGDLASGGKLLKVTVLGGSTSTEFDVAVTPGACDPAAVPARCQIESEAHTIYVDAPAGPGHIWISPNSSSSLSTTITITAEEVDAPKPEGEGCDNPFTTSSTIFSTAGGVDTFTIPENTIRSMDIAPYTVTDNSLVSCDPTTTSTTSSLNGTGIDAVIQYTIPANTVLRVTGDAAGSSLHNEINISAHATCDVTAATPQYACLPDVSTSAKDTIIDGPAGDVFLWLTSDQTDIYRSTSSGDYFFPEFKVDLEPIPVDAGESCGRAAAAATGANPVAGTSDVAVVTPSCFDSTSNVEWYSFTATQALVVAKTTGAGGVAMYTDSSYNELGCSDDGSVIGASALIAPGTTVCLAVEMGQSITSLDITESAYTGLGLNPPVDLPIERPINDSGSVDSITGDDWMSGNADVLVMGYYSEALDALKDGSGQTIYRGSADGVSTSTMGNTGIFAGNGALFLFDDTTSTSSGSRVVRIWDGVSPFWEAVPWDVPAPTYPSEPIAASAVVGNTIYYVTGDDDPQFYSLDATAPGAPVLLGTSATISDILGLAVDDTYVYVAGEVRSDFTEGVFRIPLTELSNPAYVPVDIMPGINHDGTAFPSSTISMYVDATTNPGQLYVRNAIGHVEAVINPGGPSPIYVGEVISIGGSGDEAMWLDRSTGSLYLFETDSVSTGNFLRFDP